MKATQKLWLKIMLSLLVMGVVGMISSCSDTGSGSGTGGAGDGDPDGGPTINNRVPGAPTEVVMAQGNAELTVIWTAPTDTGMINGDGTTGTITKYSVYYSTSDGFTINDAGITKVEVAGVTTYTITGLTNDTSYYARVTAWNATGESTASELATATPMMPLGILPDWQTRNENIDIVTECAIITTVQELKDMTADGTYCLTHNIDLNSEAWTPLHTQGVPFTGTLHGNGYIIYNLKIDAQDANYQGLFAALSSATVKNLGIGVENIHVGAIAGALAGHVSGTSTLLDNIGVAPMTQGSAIIAEGSIAILVGSTSPTGSYAGGIVGILAEGNLTNAVNDGLAVKGREGTSSSIYGMLGGLVGRSQGQVTGVSSGTVSIFRGEYAGGLVGYNGSRVTGSVSGDVNATSGGYVGGLAGYNDRGGRVVGSVSGNVSTTSGGYVGGLVGANFTSGTVIGTASGNVSTTGGGYVGGLAGSNNGGTVIGVASGTVKTSAVGAEHVGGLIGLNVQQSPAIGYSIGWVMVPAGNTKLKVGAVFGSGSGSTSYYNNDGGDHVGTIGTASANEINTDIAGSTGKRGTTRFGIAVNGINNAIATNMSALTVGTAVGEWAFTAGEWPKVHLPEEVTDYMDYTATPAQPTDFVD